MIHHVSAGDPDLGPVKDPRVALAQHEARGVPVEAKSEERSAKREEERERDTGGAMCMCDACR